MISALNNYPHIPTPSPPVRPNPATNGTYANKRKRVRRLIRQGRLGQAARALTPSPLAPAGAETDAALHRLHPDGPTDPFSKRGPRPPAVAISDDALTAALGSFNKGTAAGADGWTVPLLTTALGVADVRRAFIGLAGRMLNGDAPCRGILLASMLTPLQKYDAAGNAVAGAVRPIAVGSLIYRLLSKTLLRCHPLKADALEPYQLGVGSKGGVEPMLHFLQRAVDDTSDDRVVTFLDFRNAFNALDRRAIAKGVKSRAPSLYKLASWAYNAPSALLTHRSTPSDPADRPELRSAQGVRQGDPLGPALFSVAIAPLLRDLKDALGDDYDIIAYLDDIAVLGPEGALDNVSAFLRSREDCPLELNLEKSSERPLSDIRANGLNTLGSHIGPLCTRRTFIANAVAAETAKLDALTTSDDLHRQDRLLILRHCLQHNIQHLLRSIDSEGASDLWQLRDTHVIAALRAIRGAPPFEFRDATHCEYDADICALPAHLGGLGLLNHAERAPLARAAATASASATLSARLEGKSVPDGLSQHARHAPVIAERLRALWARLGDHPSARVALLEGASDLGRKWLSVIPWSRDLTIADEAVSAALFARALAGPRPGHMTPCVRCNVISGLGHADTCSSRNPARTATHESLKRLIYNALCALPCASAATEPQIGHSEERNDVGVTAVAGCPVLSAEYDISTAALTSTDHHQPATLGADAGDDRGAVLKRAEVALGVRARDKYRKQEKAGVPLGDRNGVDVPLFAPVVFSGGGIAYSETQRVLKLWQSHLPAFVYDSLFEAMSCALLTRRTYVPTRALAQARRNDLLGDGDGDDL